MTHGFLDPSAFPDENKAPSNSENDKRPGNQGVKKSADDP